MTIIRFLCTLCFGGALACGRSTEPAADAAPPDGGGSVHDSSSDADVDAGDGGDGEAGPTCLSGTVSINLHLAAGSATNYCLGAPGPCAADWFSILTADGGETLSLGPGCAPDCSDCQPVACPIVCASPTLLTDAGGHRSWDGTYVNHLTCGAASVACIQQACAPAGNYIARMCGYAEQGDASTLLPTCLGSTTPTCTDVPFTWPPPTGTSSVEGVIGEGNADGGTSD